MKALPPRQQDVLEAIVKLTEEQGYPPSLAELASQLGLKNRMTVHQHVAALKKKGLVHWEPGLNRSLRVLDEGFMHVSTAVSRDSLRNPANSSVFEGQVAEVPSAGRGVPFLGRIAAGAPIDAVEAPEYIEIESDYAKRGCFALQVKGDSMIEDGIYEGDFVIVKPNPSPLNGEIVVALLADGTATLKRLYKENGGYRLQPANSTMEPIMLSNKHDLQIQGVVVGLFRRM